MSGEASRIIDDRIILGIDPGSNIMGYAVLRWCKGRKPELVTMGVFDLRKYKDHYLTLKKVFEKVVGVIDEYHPDEMCLEAPFFGKNVQSMLKLGRAQGVAMAAGLHRDLPITEYAPLKIKMAITGQGSASKEQVAAMLQRLLRLDTKAMPKFMDATDALGVAYCHFMQQGTPVTDTHYNGWKDFINKNQGRCK